MATIAVIHTGGKQLKVSEGESLTIEKLPTQEGNTIEFAKVNLIASDDPAKVVIGTPYISGAKVVAKVLEEGRAKKVSVVKFKAKTRYHKRVGHRQPFTKVLIEKIVTE